jgi:hypothetical protein
MARLLIYTISYVELTYGVSEELGVLRYMLHMFKTSTVPKNFVPVRIGERNDINIDTQALAA